MSPVAEKPKHRRHEVQAYLDALETNLGPHVYVTLLGLKTYDTRGLHEKVRQGLSFATLERLGRTLDLSPVTVADLLHIPARTFQRRKKHGRLRPDESDRLLRLSRLLGKTLQLFEGDVAAARAWLDAPSTALGGARPIELALTEPGTSEVETLIGRLEHGVFA